jgi:uncharacterized protein YdaU (DUF1376 family)
MTTEDRSTPPPRRGATSLDWFPWYVDDFIGGTYDFSDVEVGQYVRLLLAQWRSRDAQLVQEGRIIRLLSEPLEPAVREKFTDIPGGLRNERLAREWVKAKAAYQQRVEAGRLGAAGRWGSNGGKDGEADGGADGAAMPPAMPQPTTHNEQRRTATRKRKRTPGAKAPAPTWVNEACDDWNERFGDGTAPGGRIGKGLKLIVDRYGWDTIRPAWRRYLARKDAEFQSPQDFASKLGLWLDRQAQAAPKDKRIEAAKEAIAEWLQERQGGGPDAD